MKELTHQFSVTVIKKARTSEPPSVMQRVIDFVQSIYCNSKDNFVEIVCYLYFFFIFFIRGMEPNLTWAYESGILTLTMQT